MWNRDKEIMSSYDCILPIDWNKFRNKLVPLWLDVLKGNFTWQHFLELTSTQIDSEIFQEADSLTAPTGYLDEIGWKEEIHVFHASGLRTSLLHRNYIGGDRGFWAEQYFYSATKQFAGANLAGADPYKHSPYDGYYSSLHCKPFIQVAGTKNGYRFMEGLFDIEWNEPLHVYKHHAKLGVDHTLISLLTSLFLSERSVPGINVLQVESAWPAFDDPILQGYLTPKETECLAQLIERLQSFESVQKDDLFPLFKDRVTRAAEKQLGLLTLQASLFL
jgi:hypothetical protein